MRAKARPRPNVRVLLALNLKRLRAGREWSQDALALEAGLDRTFVAHVERMKRNISLDNMEKLAAALDVPLAALMESGPHSPPANRTTREVRRTRITKATKVNRRMPARKSRRRA
ncbi:MAG: helix-turn-helix domain-containing protein [Rudaea sp.]